MNTTPAYHPARGTSFLVRLMTSPISDLLRGKVTGSCYRRGMLRDAIFGQLPPLAAELVWKVVRRTRLRPKEKSSVAAELIDHFTQGLEAGTPVEQLVNDFGDPRTAARLIRAAKLRCRPLPERAVRWVLRLGALATAAYLVLVINAFTGRPSPPVDYLARMNARALAVPEEDRAWPLYHSSHQQLGKFPGLDETTALLPNISKLPWPGEKGWAEAVAYLDAQGGAIDLLHRATKKPSLGFPLSTSADAPLGPGALFSIQLSHAEPLITLTKLLALDARRAAAEGDDDRLAADLAGFVAIARHARETPVIINDLTGISALSMGGAELRATLDRWPDALTETHLRDLAHAYAATDPLLSVRLDGERMRIEDTIQRIYTDDGGGDGQILPSWPAAFVEGPGPNTSAVNRPEEIARALALPLVASRRDLLDECHRLMDLYEAQGRSPLWEMKPSGAEEFLIRLSDNPLVKIRYLPLGILVLALDRAAVIKEIAIGQRDATLAVIAIELFRRKHGRWAESLADLTPGLLPQPPVDRFSGRPLLYKVVNGRPLLYSVGADRNDDGGEVTRHRDGRPAPDLALAWSPLGRTPEEAPDGDWVLWPPAPGE